MDHRDHRDLRDLLLPRPVFLDLLDDLSDALLDRLDLLDLPDPLDLLDPLDPLDLLDPLDPLYLDLESLFDLTSATSSSAESLDVGAAFSNIFINFFLRSGSSKMFSLYK